MTELAAAPPVEAAARVAGKPDPLLIASDSPLLVIALAAVARRAHFHIEPVVRDVRLLDVHPATQQVRHAVIAPVGGLDDALETVLGGRMAAVRTVLLLPPAAVLIHAQSVRAAEGLVSALPLSAEPQDIVRALRAPPARAGVAVAARRVLVGAGGELTAREQDVLDLLAAGSLNAEIAERLTVSINTVKTHLTRIYRKLGVRNRAEAITAYLEVA